MNFGVSSDSSGLPLALRPQLNHEQYDVGSLSVSMNWKSSSVMSVFMMRVVRVSVMCVCLVHEGRGVEEGLDGSDWNY